MLVLTAIGAALLYRGLSFYRLPIADRVEHPEYRVLRPSGIIGHGYGIVGTVLILTNLLYLVRRRLAFLTSLGSIKRWLDMHAVTGLVGSLLVLFHSAFQFRTPIATMTALSLAIVVATGVVGLYLYVLVPKAGLKPLKARLDEIQPLLPGLAQIVGERVEAVPCTRLRGDPSLLATLATVPRWIVEARGRRRAVRKAAREDVMVRALLKKDRRLARDLVGELADLAASEIDTVAGAAVMRSWRSMHRFMAILMVVSVAVHVGVAWFYGYRWLFSE